MGASSAGAHVLSFWYSPLLGLLQGLTEFLPVSSSGHLALAQMLIRGFEQPGVVYDATLHVGTALAVVWYERREILRWLTHPEGRRLLGLLAVGTMATGVLAFPLRGLAESAFERAAWVGGFLILTGCVVAGTRALAGGSSDQATTTWKQALVVGLIQGVAVFPGMSRSGVTIAAGLMAGLDRAWAARFSFLMSVPTILAVTVLEVFGERHQITGAGPSFVIACAVGALVAATAGYVALGIVVRTLESHSFHRFAWYCLPVGLLVLGLSLRGQ
jgi:undecaprenyl-diphosphatase